MVRSGIKPIRAYRLVGQTVDRRWNQTAMADKPVFVLTAVDRYDGGLTEKATEMRAVAGAFAGYRDQAGSGGFVIDNADGHLICDDGSNVLFGGISRNGHHVQSHRTHTGDRLQFVQTNVSSPRGFSDIEIFTDRNESTA